eukprot:GHVP01044088.1.p1 GENE.GHVP01044088.1~~GHVP01044088.1.p1  ORF type:complete len:217 (+),score=37.05 GHVP01044088.1:138-788(+)
MNSEIIISEEEYIETGLKKAIFWCIHQKGFERVPEDVFEILVSITIYLFTRIGKDAKNFVELAERSECNIVDMIRAIKKHDSSLGCIIDQGLISPPFSSCPNPLFFSEEVNTSKYEIVSPPTWNSLTPSARKFCTDNFETIPPGIHGSMPIFPASFFYNQTPINELPTLDDVQTANEKLKAQLYIQMHLPHVASQIPTVKEDSDDTENANVGDSKP